MLYLVNYFYNQLRFMIEDGEEGQTSGEYVAVTAVAVLIAITILYAAFSGFLETAVTSIGENLTEWVDDSFDAAGSA